MRVLLKDFYSREIKAVEVTSGDLSEQDRILFDSLQPLGIFADLDGHCIGLLVADFKLHLFLDGGCLNIQSGAASVSFHRDGDTRILNVAFGREVTCLKYSHDHLPVSTPYYTEDEEDADFGLWLANVLASEERCNIFVQGWSNSHH